MPLVSKHCCHIWLYFYFFLVIGGRANCASNIIGLVKSSFYTCWKFVQIITSLHITTPLGPWRANVSAKCSVTCITSFNMHNSTYSLPKWERVKGYVVEGCYMCMWWYCLRTEPVLCGCCGSWFLILRSKEWCGNFQARGSLSPWRRRNLGTWATGKEGPQTMTTP